MHALLSVFDIVEAAHLAPPECKQSLSEVAPSSAQGVTVASGAASSGSVAHSSGTQAPALKRKAPSPPSRPPPENNLSKHPAWQNRCHSRCQRCQRSQSLLNHRDSSDRRRRHPHRHRRRTNPSQPLAWQNDSRCQSLLSQRDSSRVRRRHPPCHRHRRANQPQPLAWQRLAREVWRASPIAASQAVGHHSPSPPPDVKVAPPSPSQPSPIEERGGRV